MIRVRQRSRAGPKFGAEVTVGARVEFRDEDLAHAALVPLYTQDRVSKGVIALRAWLRSVD